MQKIVRFLVLAVCVSLVACAPMTYELHPQWAEMRTQKEDVFVERFVPPNPISTANKEIASFCLIVKDIKTDKPVSGALVVSNLVDFRQELRSDENGIVVFPEPIGVEEGVTDGTKKSRYGKITRERTVYCRFWVEDEKGHRISDKLEVPVRILKKREEKR